MRRKTRLKRQAQEQRDLEKEMAQDTIDPDFWENMLKANGLGMSKGRLPSKRIIRKKTIAPTGGILKQ